MHLTLIGCGGPSKSPSESKITLATTTSLQESGLLDELLSLFKKKTQIDVQVVAVGSGQALKIARQCDAEVVLAHSPKAEEAFMAEGFGEQRIPIMEDRFIVVGPANDLAGVSHATAANEAFTRIAEAKELFISRADDSGTHVKEKEIWMNAGLKPMGNWYLEVGTGMAAALRMAQEKNAYILCDRGTYLANRHSGQLESLFENDRVLNNRYSMILLKKEKCRPDRFKSARQFIEFMQSKEARQIIREYGQAKYETSLYKPCLPNEK